MNRFALIACGILFWADGASGQVPWPDAPPELSAETVCLAQNVYWEARSEDEDAQRAVSHVVLNRVAHPDFPDTVCAVVREGGPAGACQFSWFCDGRSDTPFNASAWQTAIRIAQDLLNERHPDPTGGALFYHHTSVDPGWSDEFVESARLGEHVFYGRTKTPDPNVRQRATKRAK